MIKIRIVCAISQRLSHSAAPVAISEFAVPSTKQSSCQAFSCQPYRQHRIPSLTCVTDVKER